MHLITLNQFSQLKDKKIHRLTENYFHKNVDRYKRILVNAEFVLLSIWKLQQKHTYSNESHTNNR